MGPNASEITPAKAQIALYGEITPTAWNIRFETSTFSIHGESCNGIVMKIERHHCHTINGVVLQINDQLSIGLTNQLDGYTRDLC